MKDYGLEVSEANGTSLRFICRNRFFYLGITVKLWTYWMYFIITFYSFSCYRWKKKTTVMKSLSIYFGHHSFAFLKSFLNIFNKCNVLILNKYNLESVTSFTHEFVLPIFWGTRADEMGAEGREAKGQGPRNTNTPFLKKYRSSHRRCRSSHQRCSVRKIVLKSFANFTGKHLSWSLFYEVASFQPGNFLNRDSNTSASLLNLRNF